MHLSSIVEYFGKYLILAHMYTHVLFLDKTCFACIMYICTTLLAIHQYNIQWSMWFNIYMYMILWLLVLFVILLFCSCNICFIPLFYLYVYFVATLGGVSSVDPSRAAWSGRQCLRLEADEGRLWPCDPPSPQPHCRLPGAASFFLRKETEKKNKYERHLQMCA